jgi:hypothetical protein
MGNSQGGDKVGYQRRASRRSSQKKCGRTVVYHMHIRNAHPSHWTDTRPIAAHVHISQRP